MKTLATTGSLVFGALLALGAFAATILTNLAAPANGVQSISGGSEAAVGFTMGAATMDLADAQFILFNGVNSPNGTPVAGSALNVGLFADNGGQPSGSALATLSVTWTIGAVQGTYTATPNSPFALAAGTTYWILLNDPNASDTLAWQGTNTAPSAPGPPPLPATYAGAESGPPFETRGNLLVQIDATSVITGGAAPEPAPCFCWQVVFWG